MNVVILIRDEIGIAQWDVLYKDGVASLVINVLHYPRCMLCWFQLLSNSPWHCALLSHFFTFICPHLSTAFLMSSRSGTHRYFTNSFAMLEFGAAVGMKTWAWARDSNAYKVQLGRGAVQIDLPSPSFAENTASYLYYLHWLAQAPMTKRVLDYETIHKAFQMWTEDVQRRPNGKQPRGGRYTGMVDLENTSWLQIECPFGPHHGEKEMQV